MESLWLQQKVPINNNGDNGTLKVHRQEMRWMIMLSFC